MLGYLATMQSMRARQPDLYLATVGTEVEGERALEESRREAVGLVDRLVVKGKGAEAARVVRRPRGPNPGE